MKGLTKLTTAVDIKKLLESGAHFGHQTSRWHPKMAPYIHSKRDGSHIIDLTKTVSTLESALEFLSQTAAAGKQILLVSTKRQAKNKVKEVAEALQMPYVTQRWLGGMLTNKATIGGRVKYLKDLENRMASGELAAKYSKLEVQRFAEEIEQMNHLYGGIKDLAVKPGAIFVVDVLTDAIAVHEARKLGIPVVALIDSNADPSLADYPVPCNDDATKTINLILNYVQTAIESGKSKAKKVTPDKIEEEAQAKTKETNKTVEASAMEAEPGSPPAGAKKAQGVG